MSCIVLNIELADKNVVRKLGGLIDGKVQGYTFRPPEKKKPTKHVVQETCTELCGTVDVCITVRLHTFFLEL